MVGYKTIVKNDNLRKNIFKRVFFNRFSFVTFSLILIHQSVVAASTIFLTGLIEDFQSGVNYEVNLSLYFFTMMFPYVPGYFSFVTLQLWVNKSHKEYVLVLVDFLGTTCNLYRDKELRKYVESAASRSSFIVIKDVVQFFHSFMGFFLNSFLSFLVIGLIIPGDIFYGYIVSVVLCVALILFSRKHLQNAAADSERSFVNYTEVLSKIWPNISLNNLINKLSWWEIFDVRSNDYYKKNIALEVKKQFFNFLLSFFALIPTVYLLVVAILGEGSASLVAAIVVNLTRIFHILSSLSALVAESMEWAMEMARVKVIFDFLDASGWGGGSVGVISERVKINGKGLIDINGSIKEIAESDSGRYTIRGDNGSGKTSFMLVLKCFIGDASVYLPANESGLIWPGVVGEGSTGQGIMEVLLKIINGKSATHILLDEWDANLDKYNVGLLNDILEGESKKRVIVEIRH